MDGERFKKIKRYLVIYISFSLLFAVILYVQTDYERRVEQRRMLTLLANHPEWEAEIVSLWYKSDNSRISGESIEDKYGHNIKCILPQKSFLIF